MRLASAVDDTAGASQVQQVMQQQSTMQQSLMQRYMEQQPQHGNKGWEQLQKVDNPGRSILPNIPTPSPSSSVDGGSELGIHPDEGTSARASIDEAGYSGTRGYMPPEVFQSSAYALAAADVWALGICLHCSLQRALKSLYAFHSQAPYIHRVLSVLHGHGPRALARFHRSCVSPSRPYASPPHRTATQQSPARCHGSCRTH